MSRIANSPVEIPKGRGDDLWPRSQREESESGLTLTLHDDVAITQEESVEVVGSWVDKNGLAMSGTFRSL